MPTIMERMAENRTAAAETSFASFALGLISGLTRSVRASIAVLTNSRICPSDILIAASEIALKSLKWCLSMAILEDLEKRKSPLIEEIRKGIVIYNGRKR